MSRTLLYYLQEVITLITFDPLRSVLKERNLSANKLYTEGIITTNVATSINNDKPISFDNLEKICRYLDIPIEKANKIVED